jgi:hypothetical protein
MNLNGIAEGTVLSGTAMVSHNLFFYPYLVPPAQRSVEVNYPMEHGYVEAG